MGHKYILGIVLLIATGCSPRRPDTKHLLAPPDSKHLPPPLRPTGPFKFSWGASFCGGRTCEDTLLTYLPDGRVVTQTRNPPWNEKAVIQRKHLTPSQVLQ